MCLVHFLMILLHNQSTIKMCIYTQQLSKTRISVFNSLQEKGILCRFDFFLKETMVNHKKMVHPPCAFAK